MSKSNVYLNDKFYKKAQPNIMIKSNVYLNVKVKRETDPKVVRVCERLSGKIG